MDAAKRFYKNLIQLTLFLYLVLFPFGQLFNLSVTIAGKEIFIRPIDLVLVLLVPVFINKDANKSTIGKYLDTFLYVVLFSLVLSLSFIPSASVLIGTLYLIRLIFFGLFFKSLYWLLKIKHIDRRFLVNCVLLVAIATAVFGWLQYIFIFDLRFLKSLGWDDHLFRLTGTFLDPGFAGIILVIGALIAFNIFLFNRDKKFLLIMVFLTLSVALTYSRAAFLGYLSGTIVSLILYNKARYVLLIFAFFAIAILLLPRPEGEGIRIERTVSSLAKIQNYKETIAIINKAPLFGVGFDNLCFVRESFFQGTRNSHSCSGSDSSILSLLATTGVIGFIALNYFVYKIFISTESKSLFAKILYSVSVALLVNSIFINSLFYPWVMGLMVLITVAALRSETYT